MALFEITDPESGVTLELEGDSPPTEAELEEIFAGMAPKTGADAIPAEEGGDVVRGRLEALATILSGAAAEPIAGITGLATALIPGAEPGAGAAVVEDVREKLTFQPRTEAGRESLETVGEFIEPVAKVFTEAEEFLGDKTLEITGSPALAAAAKTIPTAITEVLGVAGAKGVFKVKRAAKEGELIKEIGKAVPTIEQLKDTSRTVFKEIDDLGVTMTPRAFQGLTNKLITEAKKGGLDVDITPKSNKALRRFQELVGSSPSLTEIDTLRKVAQNAARSLEPAEAAIGSRMIETIDQFLDQARPSAFRGPEGAAKDIAKRYKAARDLWGRARRSELLGEAFTKARNQASGFENGIRTQFRSILNNKKKRRFFNEGELKAMQRVVQGDKKENIAKLVGRLGFSEGGATNIIGGALGATAGAAAFGTPGAVIVPLIGQVSRKLAQRMTRANAEFADQVIRAGKDARKITQAYLENTPKKLRDPAELSELLMRPDIDLAAVPDNVVSIQAARIARERRIAAASALAAGAATSVAAEEIQIP